jgi:Uma2 family endonuclease
MSYKKYVYESYGVREYWVVNLLKRTLTQLINHDGEFIPAGIWTERDTVEAKALPGFRLEVAKALPALDEAA